jgi:hypothetical protein
MKILFNALEPNALVPIRCNFDPFSNVIDSRDLHPKKHALSMISIFAGMKMLFNALEPNALVPIRCNFDPFSNVIDSRDLHSTFVHVGNDQYLLFISNMRELRVKKSSGKHRNVIMTRKIVNKREEVVLCRLFEIVTQKSRDDQYQRINSVQQILFITPVKFIEQ